MGIKIQNNDIDKFAGWTYTWDVVNQQWSVARASVQHLVPEKVYLGSNLVYNAMDVSGRPVPNYGAGIYHNATDGIISLSADGNAWYTIADKNLGATTVYNSGDTKNEANSGKYYQWGNNYGFDGLLVTSSTQVDASSYGPNKYTGYYSDDTFITGSDDWSSVQNDDLWGDITDITAARQGPAPEGFHVPSITEWEGLITIMGGLSLTTGDGWRINLHMPFAGSRNYSTTARINQGSKGYYWSSSPCGSDNPNYARRLYLNSSSVYAGNNDRRANGLSVRCFKNSFELPTSSWTVINGTLGSAGIFWNQTDGLISITGDGSTGYTIMDKNLGATTVYSDGDTLTQDNMGNMYQWGNNYGFPSTGTLTDTSSTQVDASGYGPVEFTGYYDGDIYITGLNWSSVRNDNLWGDTNNTNAARKGPCVRGFHVPSSTELDTLRSIMNGLSLSSVDAWKTNLHMPATGRIASGKYETNSFYWSSTPSGAARATGLSFDSSIVLASVGACVANPIRPFKDEFVLPTSSWTVINGTLGSAGIFWDQTNGLISVTSDGTTGCTIADKNLGATTVYNNGDTLTKSNCGLYYQWGNNHGFIGMIEISSTLVDASTYGPGNYYSSSIFITPSASPYDWSNVQNDNLWGNTTGTDVARQGPCPSGFHVPTSTEWNSIINIMSLFSLATGSNFEDKLHLPLASRRGGKDATISTGDSAYYWASDVIGASSYYLYAYSESTPRADGGTTRSNGMSLRPFKNTPVIPAQTTAWTIIYQPS